MPLSDFGLPSFAWVLKALDKAGTALSAEAIALYYGVPLGQVAVGLGLAKTYGLVALVALPPPTYDLTPLGVAAYLDICDDHPWFDNL